MPYSNPPPPYEYTLPPHAPRYQRERDKVVRLSKQEQEGSLSRQTALEIVNHTLTNYSKSDNLIASLEAFAKKTLQINNCAIKEIDEVGSSGDMVYCVYDSKTNRSLGVLKVFQVSSANLFPEIFSLQFLNADPDLSTPTIEALGKCAIKDKNYILLCESVAPGRSFLQHYKNSLPFEDLERGMRLCGQTLAKLHRHASTTHPSFPEPLEKRTREYLAQAEEKLNLNPQTGIDIEKLKKAFESAMTNVQSEALPASIIHGDTKFANVFFDPASDTVTLIDPPKLYESLEASGNAIGIPAKDFYSFLADIEHQQVQFYLDDNNRVCSKKVLSNTQVEKLKQAFSEGYQEAGGALPTTHQLEFFTLAAHLYFIGTDNTRNPNNTIPEPLKSSKKHRLAKIYKDLQARLSK